FRYDKRNVPVANHKYVFVHYKFEDLVDDVETIIEFFKMDARFNKIVLIGHSQGSLVGMLAANSGADRFVSLSGLSKTADEAIVWQLSKQNQGLSEVAAAHFKELKETGEIKDPNPFLISIFAKANLEFLRSYMMYDPTEVIKSLNIPVLILNGDKDLQVPVDDAEALHSACPDATLQIIPNMNHVLKHLVEDTDNMKSYFSPDYPVSEDLIQSLVSFIKQ
ncbi:MAG: alpha/beta hydrolase, partial [Bacteroidia bacterium]|nr:alpha/beta hydrolase [Bacteroidia bacterium]